MCIYCTRLLYENWWFIIGCIYYLRDDCCSIFVNRIIHITFIIVVLRYPISLHRRSGFIFVKLIMMSENNFDRGEVWLKEDVTWSPQIDSLIPWKRVFLYDNGKKYVNKWYCYLLRMPGHFLVFLSNSTYSGYSVCFSLPCVVWQVKIDSFVWVPFWGGHIGFFQRG